MKKRTGAASFYIVAISAILFSIIALSFAAIVVSEANRTLNADLSQSAYDSALAGVEDAKVAALNYQSCVNQGYTKETPNSDSVVTCGEIIYYMESSNDCDAVAHILGRPVAKDSNGQEVGVVVSEKNIANLDDSTMLQVYSCVKVKTVLDDYLGTLNAANQTRIVPLRVADPSSVDSIRVSWYSDTDGTSFNYSNFSSSYVNFPSLSSTKAATPPVVSVGLIQTAPSFTMDQLDASVGDRTDRGTLFFVPSNKKTTTAHAYKNNGSTVPSNDEATYMDITNDNYLNVNEGFVKSNDKISKNVPFLVFCPENSGEDFACSATIKMPKPVGSDTRNADTFMLILSLPYGEPDTDFKIELCSTQGCKTTSITAGGTPVTTGKNLEFKNVQISIDSTGRANDLYRRVETRVENQDTYFPVATYELMMTGTDSTIDKPIITNKEFNF